MQIEKKIISFGDSSGILIPVDLMKYMDLNVGDTVIIQDDNGKKGKFVSFWKK